MSSRERILARRAQFIAAAIASAGAFGCSDDTTAQVCLEPTIDSGADTADARPMPCLDPVVDTGVMDSATPDTADSGTDSGTDAGTDATSKDTGTDSGTDATSKDTGPLPCLSPPADAG